MNRAAWEVTSAMTDVTALFPGPHKIVAQAPQQYEPFVSRSHMARLSAPLRCMHEESGVLLEHVWRSWV